MACKLVQGGDHTKYQICDTLVIGFSYVWVGLWYIVFIHFIHSNTVTCLARNLWRYLCASR